MQALQKMEIELRDKEEENSQLRSRVWALEGDAGNDQASGEKVRQLSPVIQVDMNHPSPMAVGKIGGEQPGIA